MPRQQKYKDRVQAPELVKWQDIVFGLPNRRSGRTLDIDEK